MARSGKYQRIFCLQSGFWYGDPKFNELDFTAQSVWLRLTWHMRDAATPGRLALTGRRHPLSDLLAITQTKRITVLEGALKRLVAKGICRIENNEIVCQKIIAAVTRLETWIANGKKGGNPDLLSGLSDADEERRKSTGRASEALRKSTERRPNPDEFAKLGEIQLFSPNLRLTKEVNLKDLGIGREKGDEIEDREGFVEDLSAEERARAAREFSPVENLQTEREILNHFDAHPPRRPLEPNKGAVTALAHDVVREYPNLAAEELCEELKCRCADRGLLYSGELVIFALRVAKRIEARPPQAQRATPMRARRRA